MIKRLELRNFKGVESGGLELSPLTILLGPNNSGKTTILEALFLAPNPFREAYGFRITAVEVLERLHETLGATGYIFLLRDYTADIAEIRCDKHVLRFIRHDTDIYMTAGEGEISFGELTLKGGKYIGKLGARGAMSPSYSRPLIEDALLITSRLTKEGLQSIRNKWVSIVNLGYSKKVAAEVSNFVNEEYMDLTIEPFYENFEIYAYMADGKRIRLGDLGDGVQIYTVTRILYELVKPKVLLWDDVESHMNPKMLLGVASWISELVDNGVQVILTTHSLDAARVIAASNEKASLLLTSLKDGILKTKELKLDEVEELLEAGIDIRAAESFL